MSELSLSSCPICLSEDNLSRQTIERDNRLFLWHECSECGSVLLWMGDDQWAYQKIGREDKAHLLKQSMTVAELTALLPSPEEELASAQLDVAAPDTEPPEPPESIAPEEELASAQLDVAAPDTEPPEPLESMPPETDVAATLIAVAAPDTELLEPLEATPPEEDAVTTTMPVVAPGPEPLEPRESMLPEEDAITTPVAFAAPEAESPEVLESPPPEGLPRQGPGRLFAIGVTVTLLVLIIAIVVMVGSELGWFADLPFP